MQMVVDRRSQSCMMIERRLCTKECLICMLGGGSWSAQSPSTWEVVVVVEALGG